VTFSHRPHLIPTASKREKGSSTSARVDWPSLSHHCRSWRSKRWLMGEPRWSRGREGRRRFSWGWSSPSPLRPASPRTSHGSRVSLERVRTDTLFIFSTPPLPVRIIANIFLREIRPRGAYNIPREGPVLFAVAPHVSLHFHSLYASSGTSHISFPSPLAVEEEVGS